ncbi:hypothetical protein PJE062_2273 [Pseudovibrio sp. JE062]|nr:hypothetical protein PJE062_2273 [Pseudovibrio sp. JE062]
MCCFRAKFLSLNRAGIHNVTNMRFTQTENVDRILSII